MPRLWLHQVLGWSYGVISSAPVSVHQDSILLSLLVKWGVQKGRDPLAGV